MKPVCPMDSGDMCLPHDDVGSMVSQPSARELSEINDLLWNMFTVAVFAKVSSPESARSVS